ncbi:MAG: ComEC/Rec2 family competence protein [Anaerolineae bacterium]
MRIVYLAIGWVVGILLATTFSALVPLFWLAMLGVFAFALSFFRHTRYSLLMAIAFAIALGGFRYTLVPQTSDLARYHAVGGATVEGVVIAEPDYRDDRLQIRLAVETIQFGAESYLTSGNLLVNAPPLTRVNYGDRLRVTGELSTPAVFDTFSYADYLARQGVFSLMDRASVQLVNNGEGHPFFRAIFSVKHHLMTLIESAMPDPEASLLKGILLGNERGIDPQLAEDFTRVGASHVIAISGFNMAIIAGLVMGLLEKPFRKRKWIATLIGITVVTIYTLLVGANAAVVRAAIMSSLLVIAPQLNRRTYVPASLAFVALLMSMHQPLVLWDISFQLSFFAVLGLALFTQPFERWFSHFIYAVVPRPFAQPTINFFNEPLVVSLAAMIMTLPLIVLYFGRLSLVSLIVNLLIVPVQALLLLCGGLAVIIALIAPSFAQILFWLDMLLLRWTIGVVRFFGDFVYADVAISLHPTFVWGLFAFVIGGAIVNATRPRWSDVLARWIRTQPLLPTMGLVSAGIVALMISMWFSRPDGQLHVWFLDAGHSNAVLIQTPSGDQILVDGGRFPSRLLTAIGDRVPFYDRTLELVIATHPDEFDLGALPAVLRRYDAGVILTNGQPNLGDAYAEIESAFGSAEVLSVTAGYEVLFDDGTRVEILHPTETPTLSDGLGDGMLVLRVSYGDVSFLLTSDANINAQRAVLDSGQWLGASVLQLPQHATARSLDEAFYQAVQPQVVVVQYDPTNRRGDPDADVLAVVVDAVVFTTGETGPRHLWTDGRTLWSISE